MWARIINIILGLLVMAAPTLWSYGEKAANNNYICGPLIVTFALIAITEVARNVRWFNLPAGIWLMITPLVFGNGIPVPALHVALGLSIVLFSLVKGKVRHRFGGGWRSLFQRDPSHIREAEKE